MPIQRWKLRALSLLAVLVLLSPPARAIIILGDVSQPNSTPRNLGPAPFGLSDYEGTFGNFLGTPIATRYFVTAKHIGNAGSGLFKYNNGTGTTTTYNVALAATQGDLAIWHIKDGDPSFSLFAPLYQTSNEVTQSLVTIGRGSLRGNPVFVSGGLRGWEWGGFDGKASWGTNVVSSIVNDPTFGSLLRFTFDNNGNFDEGIYSSGDSGGAVFVRDPNDSVYKLAGINSFVDVVSATANGPDLRDALFDARGFFDGPDQIVGDLPVPLGSYGTRISSRIDFINHVLGVPEPASIVLLGGGLAGSYALLRQKRRKSDNHVSVHG